MFSTLDIAMIRAQFAAWELGDVDYLDISACVMEQVPALCDWVEILRANLATASEARDQLSAALHVKNEQEKALRADLAAMTARAERAEQERNGFADLLVRVTVGRKDDIGGKHLDYRRIAEQEPDMYLRALYTDIADALDAIEEDTP